MNGIAIPLILIGLLSGDTDQQAQLSLSGRSYTVEIADDPFEQMRGLMDLEGLDNDEGMLFVYTDDRVVQFWMKNVSFPLDMIFLDRCGSVIQIHEHAIPNDTTIIRSRSPVRAVLELPGGASKRDQIRKGDKIVGGQAYFPAC